jgi:hypothetical protein
MFRACIRQGNVPTADHCEQLAHILGLFNVPGPDELEQRWERDRMANRKAALRLRKMLADQESKVGQAGATDYRLLLACLNEIEGLVGPPLPKWHWPLPPTWLAPLVMIQVALRCAGSSGKSVGRNTQAARVAELALTRLGYRNILAQDIANFWAYFNRRGDLSARVEAEVARLNRPILT